MHLEKLSKLTKQQLTEAVAKEDKLTKCFDFPFSTVDRVNIAMRKFLNKKLKTNIEIDYKQEKLFSNKRKVLIYKGLQTFFTLFN